MKTAAAGTPSVTACGRDSSLSEGAEALRSGDGETDCYVAALRPASGEPASVRRLSRQRLRLRNDKYGGGCGAGTRYETGGSGIGIEIGGGGFAENAGNQGAYLR